MLIYTPIEFGGLMYVIHSGEPMENTLGFSNLGNLVMVQIAVGNNQKHFMIIFWHFNLLHLRGIFLLFIRPQ